MTGAALLSIVQVMPRVRARVRVRVRDRVRVRGRVRVRDRDRGRVNPSAFEHRASNTAAASSEQRAASS